MRVVLLHWRMRSEHGCFMLWQERTGVAIEERRQAAEQHGLMERLDGQIKVRQRSMQEAQELKEKLARSEEGRIEAEGELMVLRGEYEEVCGEHTRVVGLVRELEGEVSGLGEEVARSKEAMLKASQAAIQEERAKALDVASFPHCVALTLSADYDELMACEESTLRFELALKHQVCSVLGLQPDSVALLCHQRGSVKTQVVLLQGSLHDGSSSKSVQQLAYDLAQAAVDVKSVFSSSGLKICAASAEVTGPISPAVLAAVQSSLAEQRVRFTIGPNTPD